MATSVITAETPMIMPSIVRPVRILFRPRALNAMRNVMTGDMERSLPSAAASAATAAATATRTAEPAAATGAESTTARLAEGREIRGRRTRLVGERDVRHDLRSLRQLTFDELRVLSVGNPEAQADRLQLFVDIQPRAPVAFHARQRTEQCIDGCGATLLRGGRCGRRCGCGRGASATLWRT